MTHAIDLAAPRFATWLAHETGIDSAILGIDMLKRTVLARVLSYKAGLSQTTQATATSDNLAAEISAEMIEAYWQQLNSAPDERQALIEALVVPETWFFRGREAFAALAKLARERLMHDPTRTVQILSAPCSSGEEPFSIAMALLDAGIDARHFTIDAIDISARAIEAAQAARYGRNSFRGHLLDFRDRYFSAVADGWQLSETIRNTVRFSRANVFEAPYAGNGGYDFIFCRNVLIYFDRPAQDRAIHALETRLARHGTFFVGPAETALMMRCAMTSTHIPLAFAFQRAAAHGNTARIGSSVPDAQPATRPAERAPRPSARPAGVASVRGGAPLAPSAQFGSTVRSAQRPATLQATPHVVEDVSLLEEAQRRADAGQFETAEKQIQDFTASHGPTGEAFYLLGLIADACARPAEASENYRKALYLEPGHYEALTHLAALLDGAGDSAGARQLLRRAERAAANPTQAPAPRGQHDAARR